MATGSFVAYYRTSTAKQSLGIDAQREAVARKDYEDRRRRQTEGQNRAKAAGVYKGRPEDVVRNAAIATMLKRGASWSQIQEDTGCSRATVAKIAKRVA